MKTNPFHFPLPHMFPHVRIAPFIPQEWEKILNAKAKKSSRVVGDPTFWLDAAKEMKFYASGRDALFVCLKELRLKPQDEVCIVKNTEGPYISGCVTKTIEKVCRWSQQFDAKTRAVLVIHEFGFPCPAEKFLPYKKQGIPIIEDCAYALGSRVEGASVGEEGDFAIYSLPKIYPIPWGGILVSKTKIVAQCPDIDIPLSMKKIISETLLKSHSFLLTWNKTRRENWGFFAKKFSDNGYRPYFALERDVVPGVYLIRVPEDFPGEELKKKFNDSGIESTQYYGQQGFYFPTHQFLTKYEKEYIVARFLVSAMP